MSFGLRRGRLTNGLRSDLVGMKVCIYMGLIFVAYHTYMHLRENSTQYIMITLPLFNSESKESEV
jgi:hypothetical protein